MEDKNRITTEQTVNLIKREISVNVIKIFKSIRVNRHNYQIAKYCQKKKSKENRKNSPRQNIPILI